MRKFWSIVEEWIPIIWGILWAVIITFGSVAILIAVTKWLLSLMGVM